MERWKWIALKEKQTDSANDRFDTHSHHPNHRTHHTTREESCFAVNAMNGVNGSHITHKHIEQRTGEWQIDWDHVRSEIIH